VAEQAEQKEGIMNHKVKNSLEQADSVTELKRQPTVKLVAVGSDVLFG
tara:strand:+ start:840 stop:983 length:144 start_codon:yes stop_codon:yes gene_type:complete